MVKHCSPIRWRRPFEPNPSGVCQLGHVSRPSAASVPPPGAAGGGKAARPPCGPFALGRLPQRAERRAKLRGEQLGLLPRREVAAFVEPVVVDQLGVGPLRPAPRRRVALPCHLRLGWAFLSRGCSRRRGTMEGTSADGWEAELGRWLE